MSPALDTMRKRSLNDRKRGFDFLEGELWALGILRILDMYMTYKLFIRLKKLMLTDRQTHSLEFCGIRGDCKVRMLYSLFCTITLVVALFDQPFKYINMCTVIIPA